MREEIVVADIGGTNARFAIARLESGQRPVLGEAIRLPTAHYSGLARAWDAFAEAIGRPVPRRAAVAVAAPIGGETIRLTNNSWMLNRALLQDQLGLERLLLLNDFGAAAYAADMLEADELAHICGPDIPLPECGVISVVGPGTGLGVAMIVRQQRHVIIETEGGHIEFAPRDPIETALAERLRRQHGRVSVERVVSGPALGGIYATLAELEGRPLAAPDDAILWARAVDQSDGLASAALDRFCLAYGSIAGDLALAHGANAVLLGGGISPRITARLRAGGFASRFTAKGRYETRMAGLPVKLMTHPEPGLLGAAAAFAHDACGQDG